VDPRATGLTRIVLGNALQRRGERENGPSGSNKPSPLSWHPLGIHLRAVWLRSASSLGEESAGLSVLAKRASDAATAQMAIHQIELALRTAWDEGRCEIGRVPQGGTTQWPAHLSIKLIKCWTLRRWPEDLDWILGENPWWLL